MPIRLRFFQGRLAVDSAQGFRVHECDGNTHFSRAPRVIPNPDLLEFVKRNKGVTVHETPAAWEVFVDPFRSTPIYVAGAKDGGVHIFSDFDDVFSLDGISDEIDESGFWETVLFEAPMGTRTLFKNLLQTIGASKVVVPKAGGRPTIERYWNYMVDADRSVRSIEQATAGLNDRLERIFRSFGGGARYSLGLSGGLDSRLTLAYLSKVVSRDNLSLFTYGYDPRILEFEYSKRLAVQLGYPLPRFHLMDLDKYREALAYLPRMTGAQIGIQHAHTLSYLRSGQEPEGRLISTFFSDAVFGYSATNRVSDGWRQSSDYRKLNMYGELLSFPRHLRDEIEDDIRQVLHAYEAGATFSNVNEYKYVTERHPKFHALMAYAFGSVVATETPFMDFDLYSYVMSLPVGFRIDKHIESAVIERFFPEISDSRIGKISSCTFKRDGRRFESQLREFPAMIGFRAINLANSLLLRFTGGEKQVLNPYLTENLGQILHKAFSGRMSGALAVLEHRGLISARQRSFFERLPSRSAELGRYFQLIALAEIAG